jgi:glycosyltransferase involved in cell wall biosynthesis
LSEVFIIIPCFNEHFLIKETVLSVIDRGWNIIVVDDGSKEGIYELLSELPIHFLQHPINLGQGAALQTGMDYAAKCNADIVAHFDADGQHRVQDLQKAIETIQKGNVDIVMGSRFLDTSDTKQIPKLRRYILILAKFVNGCFSGLWLSDAHNGLRALNRRAFTSIRLRENRMAHATEILQEIKQHNLRWQEIPVKVIYSKYTQEKGQSNWNALNIFFDLIIRKII